MWNSTFSIRATLLIIICVLNILIAILVGSQVYRSWISYGEIKALRKNADITTFFYNAEKYLSVERGTAVSAFYASEGTAEELLSSLEENRRLADQNIDQGLTLLMEVDLKPKTSSLIQKVKEKRNQLETERRTLDEAINLSIHTRDKQIPNRYFEATTGLTTDIGALIETYSLSVMSIDATVSLQIRFKHIIWEITEYAGREYAVLGALIATNSFPPNDMQARLRLWRGHVEYGWGVARDLVEAGHLQEKLTSIMTEAETHYFMAFDQTKDIFYAPGTQYLEGPYPISIELWLEMASQAVDSLFDMRDTAVEQNLHHINKMEADAGREIGFSLIFLLCAFTLSIYSIHVVIYRIARPVNTMVNALYRAMRDEPYQEINITRYSDEVGKLGEVLQAFQKNARELEYRENYLKTVLGTIMDAIVTIDSTGTMQVANPAAEGMFGYTEKEMVGQNVTMLMPERYIEAHRKGLKRYLETGEAHIMGSNKELEARRKDGTVFPIEVAIAEMNSGGGTRAFVGIMRDITERKAAERKINQYLADLEKSNRELDDFAYIASHDLKEPLRGLHNFAGFLMEDYEDRLDDEGKNMLRTIGDLTQRMENLLNTLLHYSRLGRTEMSIEETDLEALVEAAVSMFSITIKEKGANVKITCDFPRIVCDHVRIKEVFQNLIGNALKYTDQEHPVVEIGCRKDHSRKPGQMVFYIKDNGIGIEEKNLESIFKIFRRLHSQHAYGGGTGSGLTIAKKIINQHGGEIWAESEGLGKGTTFFFTIPQRKGSISKVK